jgi:hypothetical protein
MFVDEIENLTVAEDPWQTADNYSSTSIPMGTVVAALLKA